MAQTIGNIGLYLTYALMAIALLGVLFGIVMGFMHEPKKSAMGLGALVAIVILFFVGKAMTSSEIIVPGYTEGAHKGAGGGLIVTYVLAAIAAVLVVVDMVKGLFSGN